MKDGALGERATGEPPAAGEPPDLVRDEEEILRSVLAALDRPPVRPQVVADDTGTLLALRDALVEAKPEDQGPLLEQMHRVEALARQRGKSHGPPVDRQSPYFGHLRLRQAGRHRDVLIGQRGYSQPGSSVRIVDWRNAPVSRLYYRYDEGDSYEETLGEHEVEGEILARRTVSIVDAELRRVASKRGVFARERGLPWRRVDEPAFRLAAGRAEAAPRRLGLDCGDTRRPDRFLPAIAALIDPRQFDLISRPTSGTFVVQGSAGSGKTTVGLHRIAYLAFADPGYFRAQDMLVVVHQRALANYVARVLPELEVSGVNVRTFAEWAGRVRASLWPGLPREPTDEAPLLVVRAKSHAAMLGILVDRQAELASWCRAMLASSLAGVAGADTVLVAWDESRGPVDARVTALARWLMSADVPTILRARLEACGTRLRARTRDVLGEWSALLTDREGLGRGFARHAPGLFSETQLDDIHRYCAERERLRTGARDPEAGDYAVDTEDEALLLRMHQLQRGPLDGGGRPLAYHHLMIDEVQDFGPLELAVLLECTTPRKSITLAGDANQAIVPEHGFDSWPAMLVRLGLPHECIEALRISYRSTRQIMDAALAVLGPLGTEPRPDARRTGAQVETLGFASAGEVSEFLARALRDLVAREPLAAVALIARHPEQARAYYEALATADVPALRLVTDQDFSFRPGVDITDVRQTKGLEFDIVILLEAGAQSYPDHPQARRFLHVAMTRAAHQLWITYTGTPSPLLAGISPRERPG